MTQAPEGPVLITGGCGFIGSHIAEKLVSLGCQVRILDNLSSGKPRNIAAIKDRVDFIEGDIRDVEVLEEAMQGIKVVFHEAALVSVFSSVERPLENHNINITGTLNVLHAAHVAGAKRLVFASSAAVYGNDPSLPKKEMQRPQPASPYAVGKITGEYYLSVYASLYGLETVSLRYFNVYGPRQDTSSPYSGVISRFTDALRHNQDISIYGDGQQTRDFVYIGDVVQANLLAATSPNVGKGEALNVGTGHRVSLLELVDVLGRIAKKQPTPAFAEERSGDIRDSVSDIQLARKWLGYAPAWTLEAGLTELWNHLTQEKRG